jgi:hypothetical protein
MPIIQSVERALQILDLFNEQATELKITDISKLMGLSKYPPLAAENPAASRLYRSEPGKR